MSFVHHHTHTEYSLLDGAIKMGGGAQDSPNLLVKKVVELGQNAITVTDHGWIAGAVRLAKPAVEAGIKPIIGMEGYLVQQGAMTDPASGPGNNFHITLIARTQVGYYNLMRLTSLAHLYGFSYKPRLDMQTLAAHSDGLIILTGCIQGPVAQAIIHGDEKLAEQRLRMLQTISDECYVELMSHGATGGVDHVRIEDKETEEILMTETDLNGALVSLANKCGAPLVATNDAHYLNRADGDAHDTLLCIGMGAWKDKPDRMRFPAADKRAFEFYIKSEAEMLACSGADWWSTACANTQLLADSVEGCTIPLSGKIMPKFKFPLDIEAYINGESK